VKPESLLRAKGALSFQHGASPHELDGQQQALKARFNNAVDKPGRSRNESRFQRLRWQLPDYLGRCPRLMVKAAPLALFGNA
jgi:hypothetical protein